MTSDSLKNVLRVEEIGEAIDEVVAAAKEQHADVAVAGGVAMQLYGSERFTKDVDFIVDKDLYGFKHLATLMFGGWQAKTKSGVPIDMILRDDEYDELYGDALASAIRIKGVPIKVVTPEHMAALKLGAARAKDVDDLRYLMTKAPKFNYDTARRLIGKYLGVYAAREFDAYREDFELESLLEKKGRAKPRPKRHR
jgi:hypothetical protein